MKKILSVSLLLLFSIQLTFAYIPSKSLENKLSTAVIKINEIIDIKWEAYRARFIAILDDYSEKYKWNEKVEYMLDYLVDGISITATSTKKIEHPNVLLIIADDLGLDAMPWYSEGKEKPNMPNIEALMKKWVIFENLWSAPTCTPTRATILTWKSWIHTDMIQVWDVLSTSHVSLQEMLDTKKKDIYSHAVIWKWHVSDDADHPTDMWVGYYAGMLSWSARSYTNWKLTTGWKTINETSYITTKFTDLAIDWLDKQKDPWFLWLAYTAPHTPIHLPPAGLHNRSELSGTTTDIKSNPIPYYFAAIEAMDTEIGRLLESIPEDELEKITIIFIGDNGTPSEWVQSPYGKKKAKGSLYQWWVNVPMFVSGYSVNRVWEREDTLIQTSDLYSTILDITNTGVSSIYNSESFKESLTSANFEEREFVYTEWAWKRAAKSGYTIRNAQYKLIVLDTGNTEFYDLKADPYEEKNIWTSSLTNDQSVAKSALIKEAKRMRGE